MSEKPKLPQFTHVVPPRPTSSPSVKTRTAPQPFAPSPPPREEANKKIREHQEAIKRQSDHEIKVERDFSAMQRYLQGREAVDRELAAGLIVVARALGESDRLPPYLRELARTTPPATCAAPATPVYENAKKGAARAKHATWAAVALASIELARTVIEHAGELARFLGVP